MPPDEEFYEAITQQKASVAATKALAAITSASLDALGEKLAAMPNQPKTPLRSFRIPQPLYEKAQKRAAERGESLSEAVRKFLERYAK